jgi:hypothetical protein
MYAGEIYDVGDVDPHLLVLCCFQIKFATRNIGWNYDIGTPANFKFRVKRAISSFRTWI